MYHILKIKDASVELNGVYTIADLEILIEALKKTENIGKNITVEKPKKEDGEIDFKVEKESNAVVSAFIEHNLTELDNSDVAKIINKLSADYPGSSVFNLIFKDFLVPYELYKVEKLTLDFIQKSGKETYVLYGPTISHDLCKKLHEFIPENFVKILADNLKRYSVILEENEVDTIVNIFNNYIKDCVKELDK